MESDDDFDFDEKSLNDYDVNTERHPALNFCAADFEDHKSTISQSSSTLSLPVCRICQLPSMEPNNHLVRKIIMLSHCASFIDKPKQRRR